MENEPKVPESQNAPDQLKEQIEKDLKAGGRGKDTLLRITIRNQVDQIAIADNKANMIIGINTIIISLTVAGLGSGMSFAELSLLQFPHIIAPLTILMLTCTVSAVFSILAARPRFMKEKGVIDPETSSLLFFGNFKHLPLSVYIDEMYKVLKSNTLIYRNLIIDLYCNGQILSRKYRLLAFSYTSFLIGLVLCVIVYLLLTHVI
jgi:hypothetical protein